jgi:hypothetical protein
VRQFKNLPRPYPDSSQKGLKEPYDWDEYAQMYFPKAEELLKIAEEAEKAGEKEKASEYYLFVAVARFYDCIVVDGL